MTTPTIDVDSSIAVMSSPPTDHEVKDQYRKLRFSGWLIGFGTTETPDATRWTDIEIYRTAAGNYVVHTIGRSVRYHRQSARCASGKPMTVRELYDSAYSKESPTDQEPCPECTPPELEELIDNQPTLVLRRESDRHSARPISDPKDLGAALSIKREGVPFLSAVAREALREAMTKDPSLRGALDVTVQIP